MDVVITITEYKKQLKAIGYAESTIKAYAWALQCFEKYLEEKGIDNLRKVTNQTITDYQAQMMDKPIAMETKAIMIRAVKRLFESLENNHLLLINPAEGIVETCRSNRKIGRVLTMEEMTTLLAQPNLSLRTQIRDKAVMETLYSTGIRSDELLNLDVYDVDLRDKVLYIRKGKGRKQRVVPLGKNAAKYIKEYLEKIRPRYAQKNPKERKLFLSDAGLPLTWGAVRIKIDCYRKKAGIEKPVGMHAFRRSCATHMLHEGADIRYIQKLLGHKYLKTTQAYTKVMPVDIKKTHEKTHPDITGQHDED